MDTYFHPYVFPISANIHYCGACQKDLAHDRNSASVHIQPLTVPLGEVGVGQMLLGVLGLCWGGVCVGLLGELGGVAFWVIFLGGHGVVFSRLVALLIFIVDL